jgi:type II secretory pathway pseudopilin PulG
VFPISRTCCKRPGASDGFVLIELIVAMIAAVIVCAVLVLMLQVSMGEAARARAGVGATQRARLALGAIMGELHNSCVAPRVAPVLEGSDSNRLLLISAGGASGESVRLHELTLAGGTLSDTSYATTGNKPAPEWEFAKTGTTRTLATDISAAGSTPVFQYFGYGSGGELQSAALPTPLSSTGAAEASAVTVTFAPVAQRVGSSFDRSFELADTALLRLDAATPGEGAPCA